MSHADYEFGEADRNSHLLHLTSSGLQYVLAVIVLYNKSFADVPSAPVIMKWLNEPGSEFEPNYLKHLLVYDNSFLLQPLNIRSNEKIEIVHDSSNGGTRAAYLYALNVAVQRRCQWILFLDHDTNVPTNIFSAAELALVSVDLHLVCAIVPQVFEGAVSISPSRITSSGRVDALKERASVIDGLAHLTAIASGSIVRTQSLAGVLPIPDAFSLDYLDHWLFREMQVRGDRIVMSSARVQHALSVQSMELMDVNRYRSILAAELCYLRSGPGYSVGWHFFRHLGRTLKLMLLTRRLGLVAVCVRAALNILCK